MCVAPRMGYLECTEHSHPTLFLDDRDILYHESFPKYLPCCDNLRLRMHSIRHPQRTGWWITLPRDVWFDY